MESLYFKAEWFAQLKKTENSHALGDLFMGAYHIVNRLHCQLVLCPFSDWITRPDGCVIIPFIWRVPSEEQFRKCLENLQPYMEFTNVQLAQAKDFVGDPHPFVIKGGQTDILYIIQEKIDHNRKVLRKQRNLTRLRVAILLMFFVVVLFLTAVFFFPKYMNFSVPGTLISRPTDITPDYQPMNPGAEECDLRVASAKCNQREWHLLKRLECACPVVSVVALAQCGANSQLPL